MFLPLKQSIPYPTATCIFSLVKHQICDPVNIPSVYNKDIIAKPCYTSFSPPLSFSNPCALSQLCLQSPSEGFNGLIYLNTKSTPSDYIYQIHRGRVTTLDKDLPLPLPPRHLHPPCCFCTAQALYSSWWKFNLLLSVRLSWEKYKSAHPPNLSFSQTLAGIITPIST